MKIQTIQESIGKTLHLIQKKCCPSSHEEVSSTKNTEERSSSPFCLRSSYFCTSFSFWLVLLCILVLASVLRLYALDSYPQLFNQDAAVLGYDSWSVWTTGHDSRGVFFPVFFSAFGNYDPPTSRYMVAPFVSILGLSEFSTRLPLALMGIATVFFVALLGRRWFNAPTGLLAAFLLTIDPWHVNYSRIAHPATFIPFFTVISLYFFTRATSYFATNAQRQLNALIWLAGSSFSFAMLTGTYQTMKVQGPLLLCTCALAVIPYIYSKRSYLRWTDVLIWLALYCLFVSPQAIVQFRDWNPIQQEFNNINIFHQPHWLLVFFTQYANAYNPGALFFSGFGGGVQVLPPQGVGELFWLEGPLWIFAVIGMSQQRHLSRQGGFVVPILLSIWFFTFPIASSLTTGSPHEIRTYNFLPLPEILAGYGAVVAWEMLSRYRWKWFSAAQGALVISASLLIIFNHLFLSFFFAPPLLQTDATAGQIPYNIGLRPVLTTIMQQAKPCDTVWLDATNQTYIYYLFIMRYPSNLFLSTGREGNAFQNNYGSVGQVYFGSPGSQTVSLPAGCEGKPSRTFCVTRTAQILPGWQQITAERNSAGVPIWQGLVWM
jgi:4-amino-4-deoxy-L-arabinose transferase-like glycosyltransferase